MQIKIDLKNGTIEIFDKLLFLLKLTKRKREKKK